jgi:hypothetical protein
MRVCRSAALVFLAAARAQTPPSQSDQEKTIAQIRAYAQTYTANLPNFICSQLTEREIVLAPSEGLASARESSSGRGNTSRLSLSDRKSTDTFEEQLTYFDRRENYQLLKVNGKKQKPGQPRPPGMTSEGEFGTTLQMLFDPASKAEFEWKKSDTLRGQPVEVFSFRVDQSHSLAQLEVPSRTQRVGYHGLLFAQRDTYTVLRLTTEAEPPKDFPLQKVTHLLDYGPAEIAGQKFILPLHAEMQIQMSDDFMRYGREGRNSKQVYLRNRVEFREYRKYTADSVLKTDDPDKQ